MNRFERNEVCYSMSAAHEPVGRVSPGEPFVVETEDCYSGNLRTAADFFTKGMSGNPATGPVFVEGVKRGDVLAVEIRDIRTRDYAVMSLAPGAGAMGEFIEKAETTILPIRDRRVALREGVEVPVRPMIGVIGVAPAGDEVPNSTPGEHGGNMDCKEIVAGATVYLPVAVDGALLAMGDLHALMGDGEVAICGAEVSGEVTACARPLRGPLPTPAVETKEMVFFLGSEPTLDECERSVLEKAHRWLTRCLGLGANEAVRLMSLIGDLQVCQVVDPLKTMRFGFRKDALRFPEFRGSLADGFEIGSEVR